MKPKTNNIIVMSTIAHPLRTFIVGYIPHNVLSYTVSIPSYSTGIYELKEIKYIYGELYESKEI